MRETCEADLEAMRQAHRALGRNRTRVQRLLLLPAASPAPADADHPVAHVTPAWDQALRGAEHDVGREHEGGALARGPAPLRDLALSLRCRSTGAQA